ncbi:MAG: L-seryl-tRNA(Sec) selenium transferase [Acidimicrobiales bacterium]
MARPPSVDQLARSLKHQDLPHPILVEVARSAIAEDRVSEADVMARARKRSMLTPVINATGVLLHTNLGRAPFGIDVAASYSNLELSLESGRRGSRQRAVGDTLATACGAEAAMVVNNCAGAVLLTLAALGAGRGVAVSRGEMVEIGGGFRIPDVMRQSGARLVEVGTTNRSRLSDYTQAAADDEDLGMVLKVHRSNYEIVGFTEDVEIDELHQAFHSGQDSDSDHPDVAIVADIGSGLLDAACPWLTGPPPKWLADEPAAKQTLEAGADLVLFSGDKLFGGPQAGIIAGNRDLVERCGKHPLARALRPGDLVLQAMQAVTLAYLDRRGDDIGFWRMAVADISELEARAKAICENVNGSTLSIKPTATEAVPGGGTLPTVTFPSFGIRVNRDVTEQLRAAERPIVARVDQGSTILDMRTIDPADDNQIIAGLSQL